MAMIVVPLPGLGESAPAIAGAGRHGLIEHELDLHGLNVREHEAGVDLTYAALVDPEVPGDIVLAHSRVQQWLDLSQPSPALPEGTSASAGTERQFPCSVVLLRDAALVPENRTR